QGGHDVVAPGAHGGELDTMTVDVHAELRSTTDFIEDVGRAQHRFGRDTGVVEAATAEGIAFDDDGAQSELSAPNGRDIATGPGPDDREIEPLTHRYSPGARSRFLVCPR